MKDMSDCNKNNNQDVNLKEEKLFRAMSGVDEDLLLRSGQIRNSGRVHKFPMRYVTRIAAACLCFVVAGVLYMTMSSTKMADNTGNADTAAPQMAYGITEDQEIQEEAVVQLADLIQAKTKPDGLAIVMEATHYCVAWRGVKDLDSKMINSVMRGVFLKDPTCAASFCPSFPEKAEIPC